MTSAPSKQEGRKGVVCLLPDSRLAACVPCPLPPTELSHTLTSLAGVARTRPLTRAGGWPTGLWCAKRDMLISGPSNLAGPVPRPARVTFPIRGLKQRDCSSSRLACDRGDRYC